MPARNNETATENIAGIAGGAGNRAPRTTITDTIRIKLRVPARLRNLELLLLVFALAIDAGAIMLVQLGAIGTVDVTLLTLTGGLGILVLVMHIALRFVATDADPFILPIITVLNGLGIALDMQNGVIGRQPTLDEPLFIKLSQAIQEQVVEIDIDRPFTVGGTFQKCEAAFFPAQQLIDRLHPFARWAIGVHDLSAIEEHAGRYARDGMFDNKLSMFPHALEKHE